jgi:hypothetical protein
MSIVCSAFVLNASAASAGEPYQGNAE